MEVVIELLVIGVVAGRGVGIGVKPEEEEGGEAKDSVDRHGPISRGKSEAARVDQPTV